MRNVQAVEHFIGRTNEQRIFTQWLDDPRAPHILYFHDALEEPGKKGGIGKTLLMRKCQELAAQQHPELAIAFIDFFNVGDRNGVVVAERVVEALQEAYPSWVPEAFIEAIAEYRNVNKPEEAEATEARSALFKAFTADLQHLDRQLTHNQKALLVFYDTYELIEQNPIVAALRFSQRFPDMYHSKHIYVAMAGRNELDWDHPNWRGREQEVQTVALSPFSQPEMVAYIEAESAYDIDTYSAQTRALYDRTQGRPILIGLMTDVLNKHVVTLEQLAAVSQPDFEPHLVMQINNLEHPLNWIVLFMAHAYHRFNQDILNWILQESNLKRLVQDGHYDEMVSNLPTLSFVRRPGSGDDFVLHDEMRRLVNLYCWPLHDKDMRYRTAISRNVIAYYKDLMLVETDQQKQQNYRLEVLFHRLFLDVNNGLDYFEKHFNRAIDYWQSPFARIFLQQAQQFENRMTINQRHLLRLHLGTLLRAEDNSAEALDIYQELEQQTDDQWSSDHHLKLLDGKGRSYLALSRFLEAIDCFEACLRIEQAQVDESASAIRLGLLGYVYRRRGQFDKAIQYYEASMAMHKRSDNQREYANMLNNSGYVYKLQGKLDEALLRCKIALRIRHDLYRTGKIGEVPVGLTYSTIGQISLDMDDVRGADAAFTQAFEIYNRARDKRGVAATLNRFGQVAMARSNWREAKDWFERAQEASINIDFEALINSLNKQGRILVKQGHYGDAVNFFEQAVDLARQVHDDYQRTECLIDLAEALSVVQQYKHVKPLLQEAEEIARQWNYFHLLGHAAEFQGDRDYSVGLYEDAFVHYKSYCYYMAQRSPLEYSKARRKLTEQLVGVPTEHLHPIVTSLIAYWQAQNMVEKYPDFVKACQEVSDSL